MALLTAGATAGPPIEIRYLLLLMAVKPKSILGVFQFIEIDRSWGTLLGYLPIQLPGDGTAGTTECPVDSHVEIGLGVFDHDILHLAEDNLYLTAHILATPWAVDI